MTSADHSSCRTGFYDLVGSVAVDVESLFVRVVEFDSDFSSPIDRMNSELLWVGTREVQRVEKYMKWQSIKNGIVRTKFEFSCYIFSEL